MIDGQKHEYCGRINWNNEKICERCSSFHLDPKWLADDQFKTVTINTKEIEDILPLAKELIESAGWTVGKHLSIEFVPEYNDYYEGEDDEIHVVIDALDLGGFYLFPKKYEEEVPSIGETKTVLRDGWAVETTVIEHNYPHAPDWAEPVEVGNFPTAMIAICKVLEYHFKQRLENACETIVYREMDKDLPF